LIGQNNPFGFDIRVTEDVKNYICNVERVKKSYDHVDSMHEHRPPKQAPAKHLYFLEIDKRFRLGSTVLDPQIQRNNPSK
jgi:hypothetical protein